MAERASAESFSEKGFYLAEFRGRTLGLAGRADQLEPRAAIASVLDELSANGTRVVVVTSEREAAEALAGGGALEAGAARLEGAVWRHLARAPRVGVVSHGVAGFARVALEIAERLGLGKIVLLDPEGGLTRPDGSLDSFVHLDELRRGLRERGPGEAGGRAALLREIERALAAGVGAVNLCAPAGLAEELFTYAGSGTLFTRERYVLVRKLGIDDYDLAEDLIARGVAEGYLAPRSPEEVEQILVAGFGAFVEGRHLAGIGALLEHAQDAAAEIASLYTLTRFLGEGVGGHLVRFALERARERGLAYVFACTTSDRVVGFFERQGFRRVSAAKIPAAKWRDYDPERRARLVCLRSELR